MSSQEVVEHNTSTYIDVLISDYLFKATTLRNRTMILGQTCFISYLMKMGGLFMIVLRLYLLSH